MNTPSLSPSDFTTQIIVPKLRAVWQVKILVEVTVEFPVVEAKTADEARQYAVDLFTAPAHDLSVTLGGVHLPAKLITPV